MVTIGGRAHTLEEIHEVCRLGLPFVEMSLDDPESVLHWMPELLIMKENYGITYLAHYPNEDNPFDAGILSERFVPRIKALIDLSGKLAIHKATMHFWMDMRWAPEGLIALKLELLKEIVFRISFWTDSIDRPLAPAIAEIRFCEGSCEYFTADDNQQLIKVFEEKSWPELTL